MIRIIIPPKLDDLSLGNLKRVQRVLEIILDYFNLTGETNFNPSTSDEIPLERFHQAGLNYEETLAIIKIIDSEGYIVRVQNEKIREYLRHEIYGTSTDLDYLPTLGFPTERDLKYTFFKILGLERLKKIKRIVDEKIHSSATTRETKIKIFISNDEGIYRNDRKRKLNYPIRGKRSRLVSSLRNGKKDGKLLTNTFYRGNFSKLSKEIKGINNIFKKKLGLQKNLIIHVETGGYKLNGHDYNIKFI